MITRPNVQLFSASLAGLLCLACSSEVAPSEAPQDPGPAPEAQKAAPPSGPNFTTQPLGELLDAAQQFDPHCIAEVKGGGVGLIDFDRDGLLDIFVPGSQILGKPNAGPGARLFHNRGQARFDVREDLGIEWSGWGMGVAVGDLDGDGYDDIFTAALGANAVHKNIESNGQRRFQECAADSGLGDTRWGMAATLGDFDADGSLDLYLVNYLDLDLNNLPPDTTFLGETIFAGPLGLTPTADAIFHNDGRGTFTDKTFRAGVGAPDPAFGLGATTLDMNEDGLLDIYVGNDSMANFLFLNLGGFAFEDRATNMGLAANGDGREQATMGIAISDVTGDGLPDLFSTNFASDTNTLLTSRKRSSGKLGFQDRTSSKGIAQGSRSFVGWASLFGDFDLDGDEDLVVFNGHVYPERLASKMGSTSMQPPLYYVQDKSGRFHVTAAKQAGSWLVNEALYRGGVRGDLDNDGDLDLVVTALGSRPTVLVNGSATGSSQWIKVELQQAAGDRHGMGARVVLVEDGARRTKWVQPSMGFQGSGTSAVDFIPTEDALIRKVEVIWPNGELQVEDLAGRLGLITIQR